FSPKLWALIIIWVGPYLLLTLLRFQFQVTTIGEPSSWVLSLLGLQLFATVGLTTHLVLARLLALSAFGLYAIYFSGIFPTFSAVNSILPQLCVVALMAISIWLPFASGQLSLAQAGF